MLWTTMVGVALAGRNVCDVGGPGDAGLITRNGQNYATLADAIAASTDGNTIYVCQGTYAVSVAIHRSITLRAVDGPALTRLENVSHSLSPVITIDVPDGVVTVDGFSVVGSDALLEHGIEVLSRSEAQLWDLQVFGHTDHGIHGASDSDLVLVDTDVLGNLYGGILAEGTGLVGLSGSTVYANFATEGAGLWLGAGRVVVGGTVESNWADRGGGIYVRGSVTLIGTTVRTNDARESGGGIYVDAQAGRTGSRVDLTSSFVTENTANDGAGIYAESVDSNGGFTMLDLERTSISANRASHHGGGIWSGALWVMATGGEISANDAHDGGGMLVSNQGATYLGLTLVDNTALNGAGIAVAVATNVRFDSLVVSDNRASGVGGGIVTLYPSVELPEFTGIDLDNSTVSGNTAQDGGGIIILGDPSTTLMVMRVRWTTIERNVATYGGGGMWADDGWIGVYDSVVSANSAPEGAGAMVTGSEAYFWSNISSWSNLPEDVRTYADNVYVYGTTDFSCNAITCTP